MNAKRTRSPYPGISRIDQDSHRTHGWFTRVGWENGRRLPRFKSFFGDKTYGGKEAALRAAQAWQRDYSGKAPAVLVPVSPRRLHRAAIGPAMGYTNPKKQAWRTWLWSFIGGVLVHPTLLPDHEFLRSTPNGIRQSRTGNVLMMPSIEGNEIQEALDRGFTTDQCYVVDENPAVVATLQRKYPGIHTYGKSVERACREIARARVNLLAADLDFCGRISKPLLRAVAGCFDSGALDGAIVFVNVLRGREDALEQRLMPMPEKAREAISKMDQRDWWTSEDGLFPTPNDIWRIWSVWQAAGDVRRRRTWHTARAYTSPNGQSFLTVVFNPEPMKEQTPAELQVPGAPLPPKEPNEKASAYLQRLDLEQRIRLMFIATGMGITEASAIRHISNDP